MIRSLLIAAPSAPEPATNYFETLVVPLLIALVTGLLVAVVTSVLNNRQARTDRIATLRLETYRNLVLVGWRWETAFDRIAQARKAGKMDITAELEAWGAVNDELLEHVRLLPLVAGKQAVARIEGDYESLRETVKGMVEGSAERDIEGWSSTIRASMRALIDGAVEEGAREVRRPDV